jgi:ribosomal protein S25
MTNERPTAVAKDRTVHSVGCPALNDRPGCTCVSNVKTTNLAEFCRYNDLSVVTAEKALAHLQKKGLVAGFIAGDLQAPITLTAEAGKLKTMTVDELCRSNDLSVEIAEKALANLQAKGLVIGFVPGDVHARIILTAQGSQYFH